MKIKGRLIGEFYGTVGIPVVYLLNLMVIYIKPNQLSLAMWLRLVGLVVAFLGMGLWGVSYLSLGKAFGVLPKKQKKVRRGVYRFFKHPMYIGIMMSLVGLGIANQSWWGLVMTLVIVMPILVVRAKVEEKKLVS